MRLKALMVVLDGLGDLPITELGGQTPLENAKTPFFDQLASKGMCAMVDPLTPGMPVSTHTGMALLMGLTPKDVICLTRGPVEAAGIKLETQPGDVVLRCNFAHVKADQDRLKVLDRRAGRINSQTEVLAQSLNQIVLPHNITGKLYPTTQHRAVLHLQGKNVSDKVSDTDCSRIIPAYIQQCKPLVKKNAAELTAEAINHYTHQAHHILKQHPVNKQRIKEGKTPATGILCRSAGQIKSTQNVLNYYKVKVAVVSGEATIHGLSSSFGFTSINRPEFTALCDTDLTLKVSTALDALKEHDIVYLHIKGTDICAHDQLPLKKSQFIEKIDQALSGMNIDDKIIAVTADHSTNSNTGFHSGDPVPSIFYSPYGRIDKSRCFSELECMSGGLGRLSASSFLLSILDQMGHLHNFKKEDMSYIEPIHISSKFRKNAPDCM